MSPTTLSAIRHSLELDGKADPVRQVAALSSSGLFAQHVAYEREGTWWFAGGEQAAVVLYGDRVVVRDGGREEVHGLGASPGETVGRALDRLSLPMWRAYGWATFELAYAIAAPHLLSDEERSGSEPLLHLMVPTVEMALRPTGAVVSSFDPGLVADVVAVLGALDAGDGEHHPDGRRWEPDGRSPIAVGDDGSYGGIVADAVDRIRRDELEKVILSRPVGLDFAPDFGETYVAGRRGNTPARSYLLDLGGWRATGFSPEIVVEVDGDRQVRTEPLAGTRRLDADLQAGEAAYRELSTDPKEVHEHAISVRQACGELNRVCTPGSVVVREFMERKERGAVQHLGSTVTGILEGDRTCWDAFESLFPSVTASGIPKLAAFEQISRLEQTRRGLYAGAILRVGDDGTLDAALVLRTLFERGGQAWLQAGAGVVVSSLPERELTETCEKLASVAPYVEHGGAGGPAGRAVGRRAGADVAAK